MKDESKDSRTMILDGPIQAKREEASHRPSAIQAVAEPTLSDRTQALVAGLSLVLRHHGAGESLVAQLKNQLHQYLNCCTDEGEWSSRAKHMLNSPLNQYLRNPPAKQAFPDFQASGGLRRWMRARLHQFSRKNTALWYSWFQAKRAALPASEDLIEATYRKHRAALTKPDDGVDDVIDQITSLPLFRRVLNRVASSVAAGLSKSDFTATQPSTKASFEKSRAMGGAQAHLLDLVGLGGSPSRSIGSFPELVSMREDATVFALEDRKVYHNVISEVYRTGGAEEWSSLRDHLGDWDYSKPLDCMIQGVVEPLKVRVISKGPALPYYSQKPLQKAMHSAIREMPCFRLVGQKFEPTMLMDLSADVEDDATWMSIDYSAATDGLSWSYSGWILQQVVGKLPLIDQMRAFSVLGPHMLHYPKDCVEPGLQMNGQLMGSPLSFPILCLANLGVYLLANEERFKMLGWTDDQILDHVLCNGDDMLYAAPAATWDRHVEIGRAVGLAMSPGKAYVHRIYSNINSVSCHYDLGDRKSTPWQVNFLNSGLYFGQHKVLSKDKSKVGARPALSKEEKRRLREEKAQVRKDLQSEPLVTLDPARLPEQMVDEEAGFTKELLEAVERVRRGEAEPKEGLCSVINLLLEGALPGKACSLLAGFLKLHKKTLEQECLTVVRTRRHGFHIVTRNLFLPISRGGMGVVAPLGWRYEVTSNQRLLAYQLELMNRIPVVPGFCPLPGYPLGDLRTEDIMPYDVHSTEDTDFLLSGRPFGWVRSDRIGGGGRKLKRWRHLSIDITLPIRYYSPLDSVLVRRIRQPFLAGKPIPMGIRPALSEAQKSLLRPSMEEVYHRPTGSQWGEDGADAPEIWEPDQPFDRMSFAPQGKGRKAQSRANARSIAIRDSWMRDLADDGTDVSNPGPFSEDESLEESETLEEIEDPMPLPLPVLVDGVFVWE